jgi:peptidoglycan/xylan/chitin deacetylase (PgdA/CDA1 family)
MDEYKIKQRLVSAIFSRIPLATLMRLANTSNFIPYYHMVSDDEKIHIKHLYNYKNINAFKDDLEFLVKYFSPISLFDLLDFVKHGRALPEKSFLLTFDDGFSEMHDIVMPILFRKGIPAIFFINSAFIDNKELCYQHKASLLIEHFQGLKSWRLKERVSAFLKKTHFEYGDVRSALLSISYQQKELLDEIADVMEVDFAEYLARQRPYLTCDQVNFLITKGFTVGGHSIDHPLYSSLSLKDQLHQTMESVKFVRGVFNLNYGVFAFPESDNKVSREFFAQLAETGLVDVSFGTAGMVADSVSNNLQRFSMERPLIAAEKIVAFQHARKLKKLFTRNATIIRK